MHEKVRLISTQMFTFPPRRKPRHRDASPDPARRRTRRSRGQSVAEFALLLPVLLAFLGLTIDFARVFQAWIALDSATRDAAEYAATTGTDSTDALTKAKKTICLQVQNVPGFTRSGLASPNDVQQCTSPTVTVVSFSLSSTADGASSRYPIGTGTIRASLPFSMLFAYPFLTRNGTWTITSDATFSVAQGRQ
jgi:Flp pilus assembly protein TadG